MTNEELNLFRRAFDNHPGMQSFVWVQPSEGGFRASDCGDLSIKGFEDFLDRLTAQLRAEGVTVCYYGAEHPVSPFRAKGHLFLSVMHEMVDARHILQELRAKALEMMAKEPVL